MYRKQEMKLIDPSSGLMECIVCAHTHFAMYKEGGRILPDAKHCQFHCGDNLSDDEFRAYKDAHKLSQKVKSKAVDDPEMDNG